MNRGKINAEERIGLLQWLHLAENCPLGTTLSGNEISIHFPFTMRFPFTWMGSNRRIFNLEILLCSARFNPKLVSINSRLDCHIGFFFRVSSRR